MTQSTAPAYKKLRRPSDDRMIAGVCSGIARYVGVEPTLVRVGFAVLALLTWGTALLAYPVLWIIMPDEATPATPAWREPSDPTWGQPPAA